MEPIKNFEELPQDVQDALNQALLRNPKWKRLITQKASCIKKHDYIGELRVRAEMQAIKDKIIHSLNNAKISEVADMGVMTKGMSEDDRSTLNANIHALCFLADLLECYSLEASQILHKYHPDTDIEQYKTLVKLSKECKRQVKFMDETVDLEYSELFGDTADKLRELIDNKVRAFCRKVIAKTNKTKR